MTSGVHLWVSCRGKPYSIDLPKAAMMGGFTTGVVGICTLGKVMRFVEVAQSAGPSCGQLAQLSPR